MELILDGLTEGTEQIETTETTPEEEIVDGINETEETEEEEEELKLDEGYDLSEFEERFDLSQVEDSLESFRAAGLTEEQVKVVLTELTKNMDAEEEAEEEEEDPKDRTIEDIKKELNTMPLNVRRDYKKIAEFSREVLKGLPDEDINEILYDKESVLVLHRIMENMKPTKKPIVREKNKPAAKGLSVKQAWTQYKEFIGGDYEPAERLSFINELVKKSSNKKEAEKFFGQFK